MNDELLEREARAYSTFEEAVAATPPGRREEQVLSDGWSVKDVLWHVAFWWRDGEESFGKIRAGTWVDEEWPDELTNSTNARVLEESRSMSLADVEAGLEAARTGLLEAFATVAGDKEADELFASETIDHYEEHLPALHGLASL
jgi:uncharacterized damage-inducible protein DinB